LKHSVLRSHTCITPRLAQERFIVLGPMRGLSRQGWQQKQWLDHLPLVSRTDYCKLFASGAYLSA